MPISWATRDDIYVTATRTRVIHDTLTHVLRLSVPAVTRFIGGAFARQPFDWVGVIRWPRGDDDLARIGEKLVARAR